MQRKNVIALGLLFLCASFGISVNAEEEKKNSACEMYKQRLEKYEKEGVKGFNTSTGKIEMMKGQAAREVINDTKENVEIFCNS